MVTVAVIAVIVLLLGLVFYTRIYHAKADTPEESVCRTSIRTHSFLLDISEEEFAASITCEPVQHEVQDDPGDAVVKALRFCRERWEPAWSHDRPLYAQQGIYCNPCGYLALPKEVTGLAARLEKTPAPNGMMSDYLFPVPGTWEAAKPRFATLPAGQYAVLFYYIRDEAPATLPADATVPLQVSCFLANLVASGSCSRTSAKVLDRTGDFLREHKFYISAFVAHSYSVLAQAGSTGTVDEPSWAGTVLIVPNDDAVFSELGCERVSQRRERPSRVMDV